MTAKKNKQSLQRDNQEATSDSSTKYSEFLNRELSWLEFNSRVLNEAIDQRTPLLERVMFLTIFSSNLDEFYMKRVGMLKRLVEEGVIPHRSYGIAPAAQIKAIRERIINLQTAQADAYKKQILPKLAENGIHILAWDALTNDERKFANDYFHSSVFPVLTPLAVDPGHPFPFISNLSTSLGITLRHPENPEKLFARLKIPKVLPEFIRLSDAKGNIAKFISLLDIIQNNVQSLFPEMIIMDVMPFRITRNVDVEREEEDAEDLLDMITQELRQRKFERVIRLQHGPDPDPWMRNFLIQEMELTDDDIYEMPSLIDFTSLKPIASLASPTLRYESWSPVTPKPLAAEDVDLFSVIRAGDLMIHHPYESFSGSVERFLKTAAVDPDVLAIKVTLYRTGDDNPFIPLLICAAEAGKQIVCLVELKARFDEERNILMAQSLEKAGVHVVYGIVGLKTHTKTTLVVRRESGGLRCYAHIGTGNYNVATAKLYTDLSLLTCNPEITDDLVELFHYLTGRSLKRSYNRLLVAPVNMRDRFLEMIEEEIKNKAAGKPAGIVAKMNSLEDHTICRALYRASQSGVPIELIVRGFCCLRPKVPGLSENIKVTSIIGRFLEHSRIFHFRNGCENPADGEFLIGSADWMYRNLLERVEVITPILAKPLKEKCWQILQIMRNDQRQAWDMHSDGQYIQRQPPIDPAGELNILGTHKMLMDMAKKSIET